jgi:type II secretory pathway component GspD/PulD (secretin)
VLGSIPLFGRLFRNEGERAVKRNLIMFVTARKIDANGQVNAERSFE